MDVLKKVPVREQEAQVRAKNFDEVFLDIIWKKQNVKQSVVLIVRMLSV